MTNSTLGGATHRSAVSSALALTFAAAICCVDVGPAQAQQPPPSGSPYVGGEQSSEDAVALPAPPQLALDPSAGFADYRSRRAQRRARLLIAAGIGLVASAVVHAAIFAPRNICGDPARGTFRAPLISSPIIGAIGLAFTIGGGTSLVRRRRDVKHPVGDQYLAAFGVALGAAAASQLAMTLALWGDADGLCSS